MIKHPLIITPLEYVGMYNVGRIAAVFLNLFKLDQGIVLVLPSHPHTMYSKGAVKGRMCIYILSMLLDKLAS